MVRTYKWTSNVLTWNLLFFFNVNMPTKQEIILQLRIYLHPRKLKVWLHCKVHMTSEQKMCVFYTVQVFVMCFAVDSRHVGTKELWRIRIHWKCISTWSFGTNEWLLYNHSNWGGLEDGVPLDHCDTYIWWRHHEVYTKPETQVSYMIQVSLI